MSDGGRLKTIDWRFGAECQLSTSQVVQLKERIGKGGTPMDQSVVSSFKHMDNQGFIGERIVHLFGYMANFSILVATFLMCRFQPIGPDDRTFDLEYGLVASLPLLSSTMIVTTTHFTILLTTYLLLPYYLIVGKKEISFVIYPNLGLSSTLVSFATNYRLDGAEVRKNSYCSAGVVENGYTLRPLVWVRRLPLHEYF